MSCCFLTVTWNNAARTFFSRWSCKTTLELWEVPVGLVVQRTRKMTTNDVHECCAMRYVLTLIC